MYVCFDRYEFDRLFYHFARKEQEKKTLGSLGIRHLDDKCCTKSNQDKMHNFLHQTSMANEGKWLSWAPVGERSPSFASSILRPLMPLGS